jgi:N-acyl-D-amino-acid deacylase
MIRISGGRLVMAVLVVAGCAAAAGAVPEGDRAFDRGTEADRAALFDYLVETTMARDAFASLPNHPYYRAHPKGLDVVAEMRRYRDELIAADTDEKLWLALWKISNARKDTHLRVGTVAGGLVLPEAMQRNVQAPVRFAVDFSDPVDRFLFVADVGTGIEELASGPAPAPGDRLVGINGRDAGDYVEAMRPYRRYSTEDNFWWRLADDLHRTRDFVPTELYGDALELVLERRDGSRYQVSLPYLRGSEIDWRGHGEPRYPGFERVAPLSGSETFELFLPVDRSVPVVLLQWHGFRPDLPDAMDALMAYAEAEGLLDHHVIVDATRSGGGSRGAYAVQRLQPRPFRTTFGNLKVSDAMEEWVEDRIRRIRADPASARETVDEGNWLLDWLETDVRAAIAAGRRYTNDVPFKLAHLPKWADGIVEPAPVHFRGQLTVWLSSQGGSHLDQFASQVVDNGLAHVMGMSAGGFSNTWQYEEVLRFPTTGQPVASYMWSLGHSIRPNGEILQYNPAPVNEYIPQTRDNYRDYHPHLLERTFERLGLQAAGAATGSAALSGKDRHFDVLIRNGIVVDGTGGPVRRADVGIVGDRIAAISSSLAGATADRAIDATGLYVTPAFIDLHSHADRSMVLDDMDLRRARAAIVQGIATVVGAPDGRNPRFPLGDEIAAYRAHGIGLNVVPMVGHATVRDAVMGDDYERFATPAEIAAMRRLVREAMEAGAWGMGTGLEYRPGRFSHPDEVIELARVVAEHDGFHFSHMRSAGRLPKWQLPSLLHGTDAQALYSGHGGVHMLDGWATDSQDALREIIEIARVTGIPSVASHVKAKGRMSWGRALSDIILVEEARARGIPVYLDQYPYDGHSGSPATVIPLWALVDKDVDTSGGLDSPVYGQPGVFADFRGHLRRTLADSARRERLRMDTEYALDYNGGPDRILITGHPDESLVGRTIAEVAESWGRTAEETVWELSLNGFEDHRQGALLRPFSLHEKDVELYMRQPFTATSSDGRLVSGPGMHPRHYGAFARKIGHYVRDRGVIDLPFAIRSSTGLPARIIGLPDRGLLREGYAADVLVFDLERYGDHSTALEPARYAEGVEHMLVNGVFTIDGGEFQGALAGRVLERGH